jgi:hypothetical protein
MVDMFVEGIQGDVSWYFILKTMVMSIAFVWILVQKSKFDGFRTQKYNRERQLRQARRRASLKVGG